MYYSISLQNVETYILKSIFTLQRNHTNFYKFLHRNIQQRLSFQIMLSSKYSLLLLYFSVQVSVPWTCDRNSLIRDVHYINRYKPTSERYGIFHIYVSAFLREMLNAQSKYRYLGKLSALKEINIALKIKQRNLIIFEKKFLIHFYKEYNCYKFV